jgi:hypothetical protein
MFLFQIFRSFRPLVNPIGFGPSDFIELGLAAVLVLLAILWRGWIETNARKLAERTGGCMLITGALPVALRLLLLPQSPAPSPGVADDFSYLLIADTLLHGRLANPVHPLHQFFETFFVLQEPSYSSVFPIGQGIALALGRMIFGHPWAGVVLSVGGFCALCYWMLRAWTTPGWALLGGLLAGLEFGPLNQWMNSYWGGAVSAMAGCLVFGALPRLRETWRTRDAVLLGLGISMQLLTRQYESALLLLCVIAFFAPIVRQPDQLRRLGKVMPVVLLAVLPGVALTLLHNKEVTGNWTVLPNALSRYQYGVPAAFTFQPNPVPHRDLTREQGLDYELQSQIHGTAPETIRTYLDRLGARIRFYRFFFLAPLYLALPAFLWTLREYRYVWVLISVLIFALGSNFYPYFYSHYIAAVTCLFVLMSVAGLQQLSRWNLPGWIDGADAARLIVYLCLAHCFFWYGLHLTAGQAVAKDLTAGQAVAKEMIRYETWDAINQGDPDGRIAIAGQLSGMPGKQLVFVRYYPPHTFQEWVYNAADIDGSRIVWARDLGFAENEKLRSYYSDRAAWLFEPDFHPPRLTPYRSPSSPLTP